MVNPPSPESIQRAYDEGSARLVYVANGVVRIKKGGSDGDESLLPEPSEYVDLEDDTVNILQEADHETVKHWLDKIGTYLMLEGDWHTLSKLFVPILKIVH